MPEIKKPISYWYKKLKNGDVSRIADSLGLHRRTIWMVGSGRKKNDLIEEAIKICAIKREKEDKIKLQLLQETL